MSSIDSQRRKASSLASTRTSISLQSLLLLILCLVSSDTFSFRGGPSNDSNNGGRHQWGVAQAFVNVPTETCRNSCNHNCDHHHRHHPNHYQRRNQAYQSSSPFPPVKTKTKLELAPGSEAATGLVVLADYTPAATSLFNNMKLPAAVVTAGMISLGFATSFPELPRVSPSNQREYPDQLRERCESLKRLHIVVSLIAVTSELIVVLWAAVEVNQLTEKQYELATSVWDLIQRDCDLAWSAVNSHFILGIIGFVTMLALRAYVMLLAAEASTALMTAASTGTGAALCLVISIVNRGVESGGGDGYRYGSTILDLFRHYAALLSKAATASASPGPLQLSAIVLEFISLAFMANVLLFRNGKMDYDDDYGQEEMNEDGTMLNQDMDDEDEDDEECPVIDILELVPSSSATNGNTADTNQVRVVVNGDGEPFFATAKTDDELAEIERCLAVEDTKKKIKKSKQKKAIDDEEERRSSGDTSVSVF